MSRPVFGSQAADNAAWDEVRAALRAEAPVSLGDDVVDDLAGVVTPVLARLVDQAVAQCGRELQAAEHWDEVAVLRCRWLGLPHPTGVRHASDLHSGHTLVLDHRDVLIRAVEHQGSVVSAWPADGGDVLRFASDDILRVRL